MDWTQVLAIFGSNVAFMSISIGSTITLFLWARSEAREDRKETMEVIKSIRDEMKDFHERLLKIEMERK